jgi:WD40 repeat protein
MFDPYHRWLGIPRGQRPPTYYQLLGIAPDEDDREVIEEAALRQTSHVRTYQTGPYAQQCTALLNEIAQARATLLNPGKRQEYDARLGTAGEAGPGAAPGPGAAAATPLPPAEVPGRAGPAVRDGVLGSPGDALGAEGGGPIVVAHSPARWSGPSAGPVGLAYGLFLLLGGALAFWLSSQSPEPQSPLPSGAEGPAPLPPGGNPTAPAQPGVTARRWASHEMAVHAVAFSPDTRHALSGGGGYPGGPPGEALDCDLRLWDRKTGTVVRRFQGHRAPVRALAFAPDGRRAASAGGGYELRGGTVVAVDCAVRLWDVGSGQELLAFTGHTAVVRGVAFSPQGDRIVSCSADGTVRVWDTHTGQELRRLGRQAVPAESVAVSPAGTRIVCAGSDGGMRLWDAEDGRQLLVYPKSPAPIHAVAFAPDGRGVFAGGGAVRSQTAGAAAGACVVRLWDVNAAEVLRQYAGPTRPVRAVACSADGRRLVAASLDGSAYVWDLAGGKLLHRLADAAAPLGSVAVSADGRAVLAGGADGAVWSWQLPR